MERAYLNLVIHETAPAEVAVFLTVISDYQLTDGRDGDVPDRSIRLGDDHVVLSVSCDRRCS